MKMDEKNKQTIIMIGGAPATGKTTIAKHMSQQFNIPWISGDLIRGWMKTIANKNDFPNLFSISDHCAEEYYTKYSINEIVSNTHKRNEDSFIGIKNFIEKNQYWEMWEKNIFEGISIYPKFVKKLNLKDINIIPIFLIDKSNSRMREIAYDRGIWDDADKYEDWVKEKEVEFLKVFNKYYLDSCKKYNSKYFIIDNKNRTITTNKIIKYIDKELKRYIKK